MLNATIQELLTDIATNAVEAANVERAATSVAHAPREADGTRECDICMNATAEFYALVPCGHILCKRCAGQFTKCPTCAQPVSGTLRVFV